MKLSKSLPLASASAALTLWGCSPKADPAAQAQPAPATVATPAPVAAAPDASAAATTGAPGDDRARARGEDDHGHDHGDDDHGRRRGHDDHGKDDHGHDHGKDDHGKDDHGHDHGKDDHAHAHGDGMPHRFDDAKHWEKVFDDPARDEWQRPDEVIARLVTRPDMRVVDIGAGTGYFAARFAKKVPQGEVIAADIEASMITHLQERAKREGLTNLVAQLGTPDDPALGTWAGKIDLVFMSNTYHHIGDRPAYFRRVAALLAPGGKIAIVDFEVDSPRGPPKDHKLAPEVVDQELAQAGLAKVDAWDELPDQYLRVYAPAPAKTP